MQSPELLRCHPKFYRFRNSQFWFWAYPAIQQYYYQTLFRLYDTHRNFPRLNSNTPNRFIAFEPAFESEGIGGQITKWNTALILSQKFNLKFVHTPFLRSVHCQEADWERFFGFGENEIQYDEIMAEKKTKLVWLPPLEIQSGGLKCFRNKIPADFLDKTFYSSARRKTMIFHLGKPTSAFDQLPTANILRDKYWKTRSLRPIDTPFQKGKINVAVHIRRGDVRALTDNKQQMWRWVDDSYYLSICKKLCRTLGTEKVAFYIFSDGKPSEFESYLEIPNVHFHLKQNTADDAFQAFHSMVLADILVLASSSFSYIAGIISNNLKIARYPWVHHIPNGDRWIRAKVTGEFNCEPIARGLNKDSAIKIGCGVGERMR